VAGVYRFLELAGQCGYDTVFAGTRISVESILRALKTEKPDIMALSYRLTPHVAADILTVLQNKLKEDDYPPTIWVFGGTPPVCDIAVQSGLFHTAFNGEESDSRVVHWLKGDVNKPDSEPVWGETLLQRLRLQSPFPLLRHHFGLPDLGATIAGVKTLANSKALDVISVSPDQNAQEFFFRLECMDQTQDGAGGIPLRKAEDLRRIYEASRRGNYPLLRIYSGTNDLLLWAEMSTLELHNAWGAIPLFWYSALDGRSQRSVKEAIIENQTAMAWYGKRGIPVEVNEAHHWSLRGAPDEVAVAAAYLAAYNAKAQGVSDFILQMMWNTPPQIPAYQDLAKMLAKIEIVETLVGDGFRIWREVRTGLASLSPMPNIAKGELAASTLLALQVKPQIIHVVGYCEGDHAATPSEIIESCEIVRGVIKNGFSGYPDMTMVPVVQEQKLELLVKAHRILDEIGDLGQGPESFSDPEVLIAAIENHIMNAPQILKSR
jgi:uncharacterized protein (DUF433 family)